MFSDLPSYVYDTVLRPYQWAQRECLYFYLCESGTSVFHRVK